MNDFAVALIPMILVFIVPTVISICCLVIVLKARKDEEYVPCGTYSYEHVYRPALTAGRVYNIDAIEDESRKLGRLPRTVKISDIEILNSKKETLAELISKRIKVPLEINSLDPNSRGSLCRLHEWHISKLPHENCYSVTMFPFKNANSYKELSNA